MPSAAIVKHTQVATASASSCPVNACAPVGGQSVDLVQQQYFTAKAQYHNLRLWLSTTTTATATAQSCGRCCNTCGARMDMDLVCEELGSTVARVMSYEVAAPRLLGRCHVCSGSAPHDELTGMKGAAFQHMFLTSVRLVKSVMMAARVWQESSLRHIETRHFIGLMSIAGSFARANHYHYHHVLVS